jgi:hypothetical protein
MIAKRQDADRAQDAGSASLPGIAEARQHLGDADDAGQ